MILVKVLITCQQGWIGRTGLDSQSKKNNWNKETSVGEQSIRINLSQEFVSPCHQQIFIKHVYFVLDAGDAQMKKT